MEATHGFFLRSTFSGPRKGAPFLLPQRKNCQTQPEINSGWRWMFSKFLWPWGWSDFQCATLGSCDSCCVHCPPRSPAPKDLGPNCDTCGSNGNPIIPFLGKRPVLTRQQHLSQSFNINVDQSFDIKVLLWISNTQTPPFFLEGIHSSCNYQKPMATNLDQSSPPSLVPHPRSRTHWREDFEKYHHSVEDTQEAPGKGCCNFNGTWWAYQLNKKGVVEHETLKGPGATAFRGMDI